MDKSILSCVPFVSNAELLAEWFDMRFLEQELMNLTLVDSEKNEFVRSGFLLVYFKNQ